MHEGWGSLAARAALALLLLGAWFWVRSRRPGATSAGADRVPGKARAAGESDAWRAAWQRANAAPAGAAAEALLRILRDELQHGRREAAVAHWLALVAAGLDAHVDPALAIRVAAVLRDVGRKDEAAGALRAALRRCGGATGLAVAARVARAAADLDPRLAVDAAWRALSSHELDLLDRQDLERLLARLQRGQRIEPSEEARPAESEGAAGERDTVRTSTPRPGEDDHGHRGTGQPARPEPIDLGAQSRRLEVALGIPVGLEPGGVRVALEPGAGRVIGWSEIDAVAVAAVEGLGPKPVLVVDLVAGWREPAAEPLRIVRLRGDRFDPRKLVEGCASPVDALRELVDRLLAESGAQPLPDLRAARGRPFAGFRDLAAFEQDVLMAEGPSEPAGARG